MRVGLVLLSLLALSGCAVIMPVHELETPETLGAGGIRISQFSATGPVMATEQNIQASPPNFTSQIGGGRLGVGITQKLQINLEAFGGVGGGSGGSGALKYQWLGNDYFHSEGGKWAASFTARFWGSSAPKFKITSSGTVLTFNAADLTVKGYDFVHLWGYRWTKATGFYAGPKIIIANAKAEYRNVESGPIVQEETRSIFGAGGVVALFLTPHSDVIGLDLILEMEVINLPGTYVSQRYWYTTVGMSLGVPFSIPNIFAN